LHDKTVEPPHEDSEKSSRYAMERPSSFPTLAVAALVYGGWFALTAAHHVLPFAIVLFIAAPLMALHGSLQHETIHGHPTRRRAINEAIGYVPLTLWLPYPVYRDDHLRHHDSSLADPFDDPECKYVDSACWARASTIMRIIRHVNATLAGRMLIGPALAMILFWRAELAAIVAGDRRKAWIWLLHIAACVPVLFWVVVLCRIPIGEYFLAYAYGGLAVTLIRSYTEHRAVAAMAERTAIVESGPFFSLVFLNNNLHALHHERPQIAWHLLPAIYRAERERLIASNSGFVFRGYHAIFRQFLFRPVHAPPHPTR
jgi:fatty acid desaturase